ncbi:DUF4097 family beta strand repeat protein [Epidermidibacterium keratini]|uniref:DUF4097 family beta strand repeat protein n=1 Tax=Epidermidibacterium keratini TaxID=1891644 RepID=A0A7L4YPF9_9ACTN|nr:DUF4097 family beta strand repeat-containing protein [Epidermidibacterium keratini]QHC00948.1 DUF4097 family beta strand repeat protein [Epidermidibacterium keratini]
MISIDRPFAAERVSLKLPGAVRLRVRRTDGDDTIAIRSDSGDPEDLKVTERDGTLRVKHEDRCAGRAAYDVEIHSREPIDLRVAAPRLELLAEQDLGSIDLAAGAVAVELGRVGDVKVVAKSGEVRIDELDGERAFIASASADVVVDRCYASLDTRMGTGDLRVGVLAAPLAARSATGDVEAEWAGADVQVRSGSGAVSVGVRDDIATWLDLYSGTGHVEVDVPPSEPPAEDEPYVAISIATGTGNIRIFRADDPDDNDEAPGNSTDSPDTTENPKTHGNPKTNGKAQDDDSTGSP